MKFPQRLLRSQSRRVTTREVMIMDKNHQNDQSLQNEDEHFATRRKFIKSATYLGGIAALGALLTTHPIAAAAGAGRKSDSCSSCEGGCQNTCSGRCQNSCEGSCTGSCEGTCTMTCGSDCTGQCKNYCTSSSNK